MKSLRNIRIEKVQLITAAGMLDMKATAYRRFDGYPIVELRTHNKDVAERLIRMLKVGVLHGPYKREGERDLYLWQAFGEAKVREVNRLVGKYLGPTLRRKIRQSLQEGA
jgi:hypothetical protein